MAGAERRAKKGKNYSRARSAGKRERAPSHSTIVARASRSRIISPLSHRLSAHATQSRHLPVLSNCPSAHQPNFNIWSFCFSQHIFFYAYNCDRPVIYVYTIRFLFVACIQTVCFYFPQYPLPELVVIHQQQQSLEDVLSLETYIKQAWHMTLFNK